MSDIKFLSLGVGCFLAYNSMLIDPVSASNDGKGQQAGQPRFLKFPTAVVARNKHKLDLNTVLLNNHHAWL